MNSPRRPAHGLIAIALLLLAGETAWAEPGAKVLRLEMNRSEGVWMLKSLPAKEDVLATKNSQLQADLTKVIEEIRTEVGADVSDLSFEQFRSDLMDRMLPKYVGFFLDAPPTDSPDSGFFELGADYKAPASHSRKPLIISVFVPGSQALAKNPVLTTLGKVPSHDVPGLPALSDEDRETSIFVGASEEGRAHASSRGNSSDHAAAFKIAAFAFASAQKHNLQSTVPFPEAGHLDKTFEVVTAAIEKELANRFDLPGWQVFPPDRKGVDIVSDPDKPDSPWKIDISLQAVEAVKFHIQGVRMEGKPAALEKLPQSAQKIALLEEKVAEAQRAHFDSLRGRLVTKAEFAEVTKKVLDNIDRQEKVVAAGVETAGTAIVFTALYQPRITEIKGGLGYSTDKQLIGSLSLTHQNSLGDDSLLKLALTAGLEKQEGEFSYGRPFFHRRDSPFTSRMDITARYLRDDDQKIGMPAEIGFDEEQYSVNAGHTLEYKRVCADQERKPGGAIENETPLNHAYFARLATSAGLSDTRLGAPADLKAKVESGQVLFLLANLEQQWSRKLRMRAQPGLGETHLLWNIHLKKGFEAGPGDFDFFATQTAATASAYWGDITSRDFLIRLTLGGAFVTGNAPVFEEFRLGGESTVRGLEYGERVARMAFYDTVQAGVTVDRLIGIFSPATKKEEDRKPPAKATGQGAGGLDFKSIYLNAFFDYAYITRRGSRDTDGTRSLEAVGVSLEMRMPENVGKGSIEIGYAWSPDSIHEHGRIFTSARFDL